MAKYKQLSKDERKTIEELLAKRTSFGGIAKRLGRDKNTISREILRNSQPKQTGSLGMPFNNCANRGNCLWYRLCKKEDCRRRTCTGCKFCFRLCPDFKREYCDLLESPPYVCNGCSDRIKCTLEKFVYEAAAAHRASKEQMTISREGLATSPNEIERINEIISPLLKKGQSIHNIMIRHKDEIMLDEKTLYKYVKLGVFDAKVMDLLNVVKMKPRRKRPKLKVDKNYLKGRTYRDFLLFMKENPDTPVVQMDTVEGKKGYDEPVLLTIHFARDELMLAFKRDANTASSVKKIINELYDTLGYEDFTELFPVILTDQGSEFSNPLSIEADADGVIRTKVFYADPRAPYQKGACENNHSLIRRIIPKGISLKDFDEENIRLMMNHINSYHRKKLKDKSPIESFNFFHPLLLKKLGIVTIDPDEVILNPSLLR